MDKILNTNNTNLLIYIDGKLTPVKGLCVGEYEIICPCYNVPKCQDMVIIRPAGAFMGHIDNTEHVLSYNNWDLTESVESNRSIRIPKIKSSYYNKEKRVIVINWVNGDTTKVTCHEDDEWDLEKGFAMAISKYVLGNNYDAYTAFDKMLGKIKNSSKEQ